MPRPPAIVTPAFSTASAVQRRLPATRTVLPYTPADADYVRLPVGPGALHALRYGHGGPAILLIHGFTTSAPLWLAVAPLLLAQGCQVLVPDLLGFGESDRPVGGPFNIAAQARYLDRALALMRVHSVVAVGQDLGGTIAERLAAIRPERVSAIVQCSPMPGNGLGGPEIDGVQDQTGPSLLEISSRPLGVVDLLRPVLRAAVSDAATMPDRLIARFSAPYTGGQGARHLLDLARSVVEETVDAPVRGLSDVTPFRVTGEDDPMVATSAAPLIRLQHATRLLPLEQPEALADLILERVVVNIETLGTLEKGSSTR